MMRTILMLLFLGMLEQGLGWAEEVPSLPITTAADMNAIIATESHERPVVIDFWASWCPPCIIAIPNLGRLQDQYGKRGFQVVGVSMDDSADTTRETMARIPFKYPVVQGDAKFGNLYGGVLGLPLQYLVGRDGKILAIWSGEVPFARLNRDIDAALKSARAN